MARNYPADARLQCFYTENYVKEAGARLDAYVARKRGSTIASNSADAYQRKALSGLPMINPMQFARQKKLEEDAEMKRLVEEARKINYTEEMRPANARLKSKLYDGFTREGKGKYAYLKERHQKIPESKFTYPVTSGMEYGWKILDNFELKRSPHAMANVTKYEFYTRSQVPTLSNPTLNPSQLQRAQTTLL